MVKLLGSFIFARSFCWIMALQVAVKLTIPSSAIFLFLLSTSFRNFSYRGIWLITSANGIFISIFLKISKNLENCSSLLDFRSLCGNGTTGVYAGTPSLFFWSLFLFSCSSWLFFSSFFSVSSFSASVSSFHSVFLLLLKSFPLLNWIAMQSFGFFYVSLGNVPLL